MSAWKEYIAGEEIDCGNAVYLGQDGKIYKLPEATTPQPVPPANQRDLLFATQLLEAFVCEMIDHCEGDLITEEYLQAFLAKFLKKESLVKYAGK